MGRFYPAPGQHTVNPNKSNRIVLHNHPHNPAPASILEILKIRSGLFFGMTVKILLILYYLPPLNERNAYE
jgi:hypothetical protein